MPGLKRWIQPCPVIDVSIALVIHSPLEIDTLFGVLLLPKTALGQTSKQVVITSCYDGDTCTSSIGEKIRLACIDTPELRGKRADPVPAKEARDYLRELVVGRKVTIRRITTDRYGRTRGRALLKRLGWSLPGGGSCSLQLMYRLEFCGLQIKPTMLFISSTCLFLQRCTRNG